MIGDGFDWCCHMAAETQGDRHDIDCPLREDWEDYEDAFSDMDFGDK